MTTYIIEPGIAALVAVRSSDGKWNESAIFLSHEKGVVLGLRTPMVGSSLPQPVQDSIIKHFHHVFNLEHETWREKGPSPRAVYCDAAQPWTIEVNECPS